MFHSSFDFAMQIHKELGNTSQQQLSMFSLCVILFLLEDTKTLSYTTFHSYSFFQTTNENWTPCILNEAEKIIYKVLYYYYQSKNSFVSFLGAST